jgi:lipopolysaccharide/colanic/teichoic acid biosynthesis glycosyltransferase
MADWTSRFISLIALIVLLPVMIISALGILIFDFGPVFYQAKRAGLNNQSFRILKFRTMRVKGAHASRVTSKNDSRVFFFGKVLRTLKIDELPQLINILRGDMAIIGPRPEDQDIVNEHYDELMMESLKVLPGLASPGSVYNYTHLESLLDADADEKTYINEVLPIKVRLDVYYARNKSLTYDVRLILRTISVILQKAFGRNRFNEPFELTKVKMM